MSEKEQNVPVDITTDTSSDMLFDFASEAFPAAVPLDELPETTKPVYERLGPTTEEIEQQEKERDSAFYEVGYTKVITGSIPMRPYTPRNHNSSAANKAREEAYEVYAQINHQTGPLTSGDLPAEFDTLSKEAHDASDERLRQQGISDNQVAALRRVQELRKQRHS